MNNTAELALSVNAPTGSLVRARWSTRVQFAALGILSGAWGAHMPSIKQHFDLTEASLSMLLLAVAFGVLSSLMFVGRVVERLTARGAALIGGLLIATALAAILYAPSFIFAFPIAFLLGASMSLFDVSINAEGTELEHVGGKPIMSNLHGMFSTGGMAGAALVALLLRLEMMPAQQLALISGVLAVVIAIASRGMLITHSTSDEPQQNFAWPRGLLLVIGLLILAGMIAEGRAIAKIHPNMVVKIPMTAEGMKAVKGLAKAGIRTNVTLIFSANQALLAARAGASFVSPFVGRIDDIGWDGVELIQTISEIFELHGIETKIIAASIRKPQHITQCALAGADIATVPFQVLMDAMKHPLTDNGIARFKADWAAALV